MAPPDSTTAALASAGGKPFLYLVQGKRTLPDHYAELVSPRSDMIQLTWGEPVEGAIYFPKSTWTEGRNRLLQEALARPEKPLYYIFLDDDIVFEEGGWRLFEEGLLTYRPAIAVPGYPVYWAFDPSIFIPLPGVDAQTCFWYDAMYTAFHRDIVEDGILLPYYTGLDKASWIYSQWFVVELVKALYPGRALQMNRVRIANATHDSDYGVISDLNVSAKVLFTEVFRRRYVLRRAQGWIKRRLGIPEFTPRPASAPPPSYRLSERTKRRWLNLGTPFWRDRRPISFPVSYVPAHADV